VWGGFLSKKNLDREPRVKLFDHLIQLPHLLRHDLELSTGMVAQAKSVAQKFQHAKGFFFIGRGYSYPLAFEGALKLKEIAYIHAEGYPAGELKHGPIAMIDEGMVVVVVAPNDRWREKTLSNLEEVRARGAQILGIGDISLKSHCDGWIGVGDPAKEDAKISESLVPFLIAPALQLLSYELALLKGTDVDKPRNLAKSVTVE
jgi:glucosamine--fructose-6-phosphate aminotransferase (isomerizing)